MKGTLLDTTVLIDLPQGNTATTMIQDLDLVTDNERHFKVIPDLRVERPYSRTTGRWIAWKLSGQAGLPHQIAIALAGGATPLVDGPYH